MRGLRTKFGFAWSGLVLTCLVAAPATAKVVFSFSGTVAFVSDYGATPPAGVSVGDPVSGTISYIPGDGQGTEIGPSEWTYVFDDSELVLQVTIGTRTWITSLATVVVCDDSCGGDVLNFLGDATSISEFPGLVEWGGLNAAYDDIVEPYSLVNGTALPNGQQDVDLGGVNMRAGSITSGSGSGSYWIIAFTLDYSIVPVQSITWSQVKQLYARH